MTDRERYAYSAEGATKMVYFVHGYGDRSGRYLEFADYLNRHGISFYTHDLAGYGKSGPVNGMMVSNILNLFFLFRTREIDA